MQHSDNQVTSNLHRLVNVAHDHVVQDSTGLINKILPPQFSGKLPMINLLLSSLKIPKPEIMLSSIFEKLANFPPEFWIMIEDMIIGVIEGEEESETKLLALIGVITNADQHQE